MNFEATGSYLTYGPLLLKWCHEWWLCCFKNLLLHKYSYSGEQMFLMGQVSRCHECYWRARWRGVLHQLLQVQVSNTCTAAPLGHMTGAPLLQLHHCTLADVLLLQLHHWIMIATPFILLHNLNMWQLHNSNGCTTWTCDSCTTSTSAPLEPVPLAPLLLLLHLNI